MTIAKAILAVAVLLVGAFQHSNCLANDDDLRIVMVCWNWEGHSSSIVIRDKEVTTGSRSMLSTNPEGDISLPKRISEEQYRQLLLTIADLGFFTVPGEVGSDITHRLQRTCEIELRQSAQRHKIRHFLLTQDDDPLSKTLKAFEDFLYSLAK